MIHPWTTRSLCRTQHCSVTLCASELLRGNLPVCFVAKTVERSCFSRVNEAFRVFGMSWWKTSSEYLYLLRLICRKRKKHSVYWTQTLLIVTVNSLETFQNEGEIFLQCLLSLGLSDSSLSFSPAATNCSVSIWVQHPLSRSHRCLSVSSFSRLADTSHPSCYDLPCWLTPDTHSSTFWSLYSWTLLFAFLIKCFSRKDAHCCSMSVQSFVCLLCFDFVCSIIYWRSFDCD